MLELINGCFFLEERKILNNISLSLSPGECVVIWGLNGVGKSSLLDILSGWRTLGSSQGEVLLNQKNMRDWAPKERAGILAYLAQSQEVLFDDSVRELLKILDPLELLIERLAGDFKIFNLLDRNFYSLSGGEKMKVALLRVILQLRVFNQDLKGAYLLLDEPLAHLDQIYQQEFLSNLLKLKQEGLGILIVLHDLNLAWKYADRFLIYFNGQLHECENKNEDKDKEGLVKKIKDFYGVDLKQERAWSF